MITIKSNINWEEWDNFISNIPRANFFHTSSFLKALNKYYNYNIYSMLLKNKGELIGVLPFTEKKKYGFTIIESLPFGIPSGPLFKNNNQNDYSYRLINSLNKLLGQKTVCIRGVYNYNKSIETNPLNEIKAHKIDLNPGYNYIFNNIIISSKRRQIKQAQMKGVSIRISNNYNDLQSWYKIYINNTKKWHIKTPHSLDFLYHLINNDNVDLLIAQYDNCIIGGSIDLCFNKEAYFWLGAVDENYKNYKTSALLYDFRLKNSCKKGMKRLNLGFSSKKPNLARYKYDFGGRPSNYIVNNNSVIWFNILQKIKNKFCD